MDPALHQNQPELGVPVLPIPLQMLPDAHSLLDEVVSVLGELRGGALRLQDTQDLVAGHETDLCDSMRIPEDDTDLRGGETLLGELEDLVADLLVGDLEPLWDRPPVGERGLGNSLTGRVHTTHSGF